MKGKMMKTFKVGDTVIVIEGGSQFLEVGEVGVITETTDDDVRIRSNNPSFYPGHWYIGYDRIEHLKIKATKIAKAFYKGKINKEEDGYLWLNSK